MDKSFVFANIWEINLSIKLFNEPLVSPKDTWWLLDGYIFAFLWRFLITTQDKGEEGLFFRVRVDRIAEKPPG